MAATVAVNTVISTVELIKAVSLAVKKLRHKCRIGALKNRQLDHHLKTVAMLPLNQSNHRRSNESSGDNESSDSTSPSKLFE
jgi:hypothetical protein